MEFLNNGMQLVGWHEYEFIILCRILLVRKLCLASHQEWAYTLLHNIFILQKILIAVAEVLTLLLFILMRVVVYCVCVLR